MAQGDIASEDARTVARQTVAKSSAKLRSSAPAQLIKAERSMPLPYPLSREINRYPTDGAKEAGDRKRRFFRQP